MKKNSEYSTTNTLAVELAYQQGMIDSLDLHGRFPDTVEHDVDRFLTQMYHKGVSGCALICGTGTGVMKKKVKDILRIYMRGYVAEVVDVGPVLLVVFHL